MRPSRVRITDRKQARHLANGARLGDHFLFLALDQIDLGKVEIDDSIHPLLARARTDDRTRARLVIPLSEYESTNVGGLRIKSAVAPSLTLQSVTADRDLYRAEEDTAHLLVVDLNNPGAVIGLELYQEDAANGLCIDRREISLNESGLGLTRYTNLPIGTYTACLGGDSEVFGHACVCHFTVARFDLAPLVATLGKAQLRGQTLSCSIHLTRFDHPLDASVRVDLMDGRNRIDSRPTRSRGGIAIVELEIDGDGPHHLEIVLQDDSSSTATVPLPGSSRNEREETSLVGNGNKTAASLLPGSDTAKVLGLHIAPTETDNSPIILEDRHNGQVFIKAMQAIEDCVVSTIPFRQSVGSDARSWRVPTSTGEVGPSIIRVGDLAAGSQVEIAVTGPAGIVAIGAFVDGKPWESRAVTVTDTTGKFEINLYAANQPRTVVHQPHDIQFDPGSTVKIEVARTEAVENAADSGHALITVRDARLQPSSHPEQKLASRVKDAAGESEPGPVNIRLANRSDYFDEAHPYWSYVANRVPAIDTETLSQLVQREILTDEQADHILDSASECQQPLYSLIVENGYAEADELSAALASIYGYEFIDADSLSIDESILELCPESVARENVVIPIREDQQGNLVFVTANPADLETVEKLRFILNRRIEIVVGTTDAIEAAINHFYGQIEGETADSMLQEFTDTAISFTETMDAGSSDAMPAAVPEDAARNRGERFAESLPEPMPVIACELVEFRDRAASTLVELPDLPGRYEVDVFAVVNRQWHREVHHLDVGADPYIKMQLPETLYSGDEANGRLVARCASGNYSVQLERDGEPIAFHESESPHSRVSGEQISVEEFEAYFPVLQGRYTATVTDHRNGASRVDQRDVRVLGKFTQNCRRVRLLEKDSRVEVSDAVSRIRLLPSIQPFKATVANATADYTHLCCEQTAAKMMSAIVCLADQVAQGESIDQTVTAIRVGLQRLRTMWNPARGFRMYPAQDFNDTWGRMATEHLLKVNLVSDAIETANVELATLSEVRQLADESSSYYRIVWPPRTVNSCQDAYLNIRMGEGDQKESLRYIRNQLRQERTGIRSFQRSEQALALAGLLRYGDDGDLADTIRSANELFDSIGPEGRLYSTVDSISLIVLLIELGRRESLTSECTVRLNGERMTIADALAADTRIETLGCQSGTCLVQFMYERRSDWAQFASNTPITVSLRNRGRTSKKCHVGEVIDLCVEINDGYHAGDLIWVALPPCLSRIEGGGQVKLFSIDPQCASKVQIPLAVTSTSFPVFEEASHQHFFVCLRNMYDEERIGSPGPIPVQAEAK